MIVYKTRYQAKKHARGDEVVVKIDGEYTIMNAFYYYNVWRNQK